MIVPSFGFVVYAHAPAKQVDGKEGGGGGGSCSLDDSSHLLVAACLGAGPRFQANSIPFRKQAKE